MKRLVVGGVALAILGGLGFLVIVERAMAQEPAKTDVSRLVKILLDSRQTAEAKGAACVELMELGPRAKSAVPALVSLLKDKDQTLRDYAVTTLMKIGPDAKSAVPALKQVAASDPENDLRELARSAVAAIEESKSPAASPATPSPAPAPATGRARAGEALPARENRTAGPATDVSRPPLIHQQGRYFSWASPQGWRFSESTNGATVMSPDRKRQAGFCLLLRMQGQFTPEQFAAYASRLAGEQNFRIVSAKHVSSPGPGMATSEIEYTCTDPNLGDRHAGVTVTIVQGYGQSDAYWQWCSTTPDNWEQDKLWLPVLSRSVTITNPGEVAGNNTLLKPRNNPLDNSGLIKSWEAKGLSQDRISQARREGMMGYERQKSPTTGTIYEVPLESYDGTKGGYHNPDRYDEILERAPVGE